jgi:hypothetical protein
MRLLNTQSIILSRSMYKKKLKKQISQRFTRSTAVSPYTSYTRSRLCLHRKLYYITLTQAASCRIWYHYRQNTLNIRRDTWLDLFQLLEKLVEELLLHLLTPFSSDVARRALEQSGNVKLNRTGAELLTYRQDSLTSTDHLILGPPTDHEPERDSLLQWSGLRASQRF